MTEAVNVCVICVSVPKKMLNKALEDHAFIDFKTYQKTCRKLAEIEEAMHQLRNLQSVVEQINHRWLPSTPLPCNSLKNTHT